MSPSLPPYLTSGASSRSHHSLLVKLHEAKSDQEEDEILEKEIVRQKELMSAKGQSTVCSLYPFLIHQTEVQARLSESLIVLLHVAMLRHGTTTDLDFALVHALHLADSGRTIQEKRIGQSLFHQIHDKNIDPDVDRISIPPGAAPTGT